MPDAPRTFRSNPPRKRNAGIKTWDDRKPAHERGYDWDWHKLRNNFIKQNPLCEHCERRRGKLVEAEEVDHIIPFDGLKDPLRLDWTNLQSLCKQCHRLKTLRDQKKGMGMLHIICGPPGAGKTTFVNENKRNTDLVFDFDVIAQALGAPIYEHTKDFIDPVESIRDLILNHSKRADHSVWVIYTSIKRAVRDAQRYGGKLCFIDTPLQACIQRLRHDNRPCIDSRIDAVNAWWCEYDALKDELKTC